MFCPIVSPFLFQLPPQFELDCDRRARFLAMLRYRCAFEFRHPAGMRHKSSTCSGQPLPLPLGSPWIVTAKHVYVRGHGPDGRYKDKYAERTLREWADHIRNWRRKGRTVFAFFDNDQKSAAPADAQRLMALIGIERDECAEHVRRSLPRRRDWQRTTVSSRP